jgi:hypothetical protein
MAGREQGWVHDAAASCSPPRLREAPLPTRLVPRKPYLCLRRFRCNRAQRLAAWHSRPGLGAPSGALRTALGPLLALVAAFLTLTLGLVLALLFALASPLVLVPARRCAVRRLRAPPRRPRLAVLGCLAMRCRRRQLGSFTSGGQGSIKTSQRHGLVLRHANRQGHVCSRHPHDGQPPRDRHGLHKSREPQRLKGA